MTNLGSIRRTGPGLRRGDLFALALTLTILPVQAWAQANQCRVPERLEEPKAESPRAGDSNTVPATGNLLSLSWSPQYCREHASEPKNRWQCSKEAGQFGFILHGLWPDAPGRADPAWCAPAKPLPRALIRQHFCMTPSPQLLQHEWAKHGTCATDKPEKYFKAASLLYGAIKYPDLEALSFKRLSVGSFSVAFLRANPGLRPGMMSVDISRDGWFEGVRICLDTALRPRLCPREDRGAKPGRPLRIWLGR
jgi:ribonuclease T2